MLASSKVSFAPRRRASTTVRRASPFVWNWRADLSASTGLQQTEQDAMAAANLLRECEAMEAEIAMLKNKRSATEVRVQCQSSLKATLTLLEPLAHHHRRVSGAARRATQQDGSNWTQDGGGD